MSTRPLRQYYDPVSIAIPDDLGFGVDGWLRHRVRFADALGALTDAQWKATTRCTAWDAKDVISHLVNVDAFWVLVLGAARAGNPPTEYLRNFDPSTATDALDARMRDLTSTQMLEQFVAGTAAFAAVVQQFTPTDWSSMGESPLGHLPARFLFAHACWDSWLHERDILEPLELAPPIDDNELDAAVGFSLVFAGIQGGLVNDPTPVGPGLTEPLDVTLAFAELPETALRAEFAAGVRISRADAATASTAVSALDVVECLAGRRPMHLLDGALPDALRAQFDRATQVL